MLNSTKLRQVIAVDRCGSFSRAADSLNITQSTVTKAVADVERDLGYSLFDRRARGTTTTEEGRDFLNRAARIVADMELLSEDVQASKLAKETVLRVGVSPSSIEGLLNRAVKRLIAQNPNLCLNLTAMPVERGLRMLRRGDIDILVGPDDIFGKDPDYQIYSLGELDAVIFGRKDHPLSAMPHLKPCDIAEYSIISPDLVSSYANRLTSLYGDAGKDPSRHIHVVENFPMVLDLVASTDLLATVSVDYARSARFQGEFWVVDIDLFEPFPLCCAYRSKWLPSHPMRSFIAAMTDLSPTGKSL